MALKALITGTLAEPVLRWTPKQQAVLDLRINATARAQNESTKQWEEVGDPLWISVSFWDQRAQQYNESLHKGDRITVEGTLALEKYQKRDGSEGFNLYLRKPNLLGVIPRQGGVPQVDAPSSGGASYGPPSDDPWGAQSDPGEAPF